MGSRHPHLVRFAWSLAIGGALIFAFVASSVAAGLTAGLDQQLLLSLRDPSDVSNALGADWFEEMVMEITVLGGFTALVIVCLVTVVTLLLLGQYQATAFLVTVITTGSLLSAFLKDQFSRARPEVVEHLDRVFTSSFPSGHSMVSMLTWLTLAAVAVRFVPRHALRLFLLISAVVLSLMIGISRVYLGVHWPTDVIAGWALGLSWASASWLAAHYLSRKRGGDAELGHSKA